MRAIITAAPPVIHACTDSSRRELNTMHTLEFTIRGDGFQGTAVWTSQQCQAANLLTMHAAEGLPELSASAQSWSRTQLVALYDPEPGKCNERSWAEANIAIEATCSAPLPSLATATTADASTLGHAVSRARLSLCARPCMTLGVG